MEPPETSLKKFAFDTPPKKVRAETERLLADETLSDSELRNELSQLSRAWAFGGFTWLWGPQLYKRNRITFIPFIDQHFSSWSYGSIVTQVKWKHKAQYLEPWLKQVDENDDIKLFQRLYNWKHQRHWSYKAIRNRLIDRFEKAESTGQRLQVLEKFQLIWFDLDEESACKLYAAEPNHTVEFLERRILRGGWNPEKRKPWPKLLKLAEVNDNQKFANLIYRYRTPVNKWQEDVEHACETINSPKKLNQWLQDHHLSGWLSLGKVTILALEKRGEDVLPYFLTKLSTIQRGLLLDGKFRKVKKMAEQNEWWELWTRLYREVGRKKEISELVQELLKLDEATARQRFCYLSGVTREFNFPGAGFARVRPLEDKDALALYKKYPDLIQGPFRKSIQSSYWNRYPKLTKAFIHNDDLPMIDFMAGRVLSYQSYWYNKKKSADEIDVLYAYYENLRQDPKNFAERSASALAQIPAFSIFNYRELIRSNKLSRLLFQRSPEEFLASDYAVGELIEAQEINVMGIAYRVLGLDHPRARELAVSHIDILLGTFLRPIHRKTRFNAFKALQNAASNEMNARRILDKAREAMDLPDQKYPKEQLVGFIGQLIHRYPQLRTPAEQPIVYRKQID